MSLSRSGIGEHGACSREGVSEDGGEVEGGREGMHALAHAAQQTDQDVGDGLRPEIIDRDILALGDESDELPLALLAHADEALKESRLSVQRSEEVRVLLRCALERAEVLNSQLEQIVDDDRPATGTPGQELPREDLRLGVGIDTDDRILLGAEVVEERASGYTDLIAELLDGETGEAVFGSEPSRSGGQT